MPTESFVGILCNGEITLYLTCDDRMLWTVTNKRLRWIPSYVNCILIGNKDHINSKTRPPKLCFFPNVELRLCSATVKRKWLTEPQRDSESAFCLIPPHSSHGAHPCGSMGKSHHGLHHLTRRLGLIKVGIQISQLWKLTKKITVEHVKTNSHQFQIQLKLGKNFLKSEYNFNSI